MSKKPQTERDRQRLRAQQLSKAAHSKRNEETVTNLKYAKIMEEYGEPVTLSDNNKVLDDENQRSAGDSIIPMKKTFDQKLLLDDVDKIDEDD